jgi:hypothetical protein
LPFGVVTPHETRVAESADVSTVDTLIVATPPVVLRILMIRPSGDGIQRALDRS